jgi:phosphoribosylamine--glycine ligase
MKVLVVGNGGREHALAWRLKNSSSCDSVYILPGNAGTLEVGENLPGKVEDPKDILNAARKVKADLVVIGPEAPLVKGVADILRSEGFNVFGPSKAAAMIEGSKAYAKWLMQKYHVPTGKAEIFEDHERALSYLENLEPPIVVKADGLAAGKGVVVAKTIEEAKEAVRNIMVEKKFGEAGNRILIEEFLEGEEVSFFVVSDGVRFIPLTSAQDYKRAYDNDQGPNTGGMGSYSPFPLMTSADEQDILDRIFQPVLEALSQEGAPYVGTLYGGLIKTQEGFKVLEFNCRFGDPETQVILPRIEGDFCGLLAAAAEGNLNNAPRISISNEKALTVVLASGGYPEKYETGYEITGLKDAEKEGVIIFHAGTKKEEEKIVTAGGRVLNVTALDQTFKDAREKAYRAVQKIYFKNIHYRNDIGERVIILET